MSGARSLADGARYFRGARRLVLQEGRRAGTGQGGGRGSQSISNRPLLNPSPYRRGLFSSASTVRTAECALFQTPPVLFPLASRHWHRSLLDYTRVVLTTCPGERIAIVTPSPPGPHIVTSASPLRTVACYVIGVALAGPNQRSASAGQMRAFCGDKSSAITAPASTRVLPPPSKP